MLPRVAMSMTEIARAGADNFLHTRPGMHDNHMMLGYVKNHQPVLSHSHPGPRATCHVEHFFMILRGPLKTGFAVWNMARLYGMIGNTQI